MYAVEVAAEITGGPFNAKLTKCKTAVTSLAGRRGIVFQRQTAVASAP
jgi:hypothetical protein